MILDLTAGAGAAFGTADGRSYLDFLRSRVRHAAAMSFVIALLFAAADPYITPTEAGWLHLLKLPVFITCVWLWRFAARATSPRQLINATLAMLLLCLLISTPSTILVGVSWQSMTMAGAVALCAAAFLPWGLRAQVYLVVGMLPCALVPMAVLGVGRSAIFPLIAALFPLVVSIVFAWQNEDHRLGMQRSLESFRENVQRLRLLTENIQGVLWLTEMDGALLYVSPRFEDIWGQSQSGLQRRPEAWLGAVHPDDRSAVESWFRREPVDGSTICEYRVMRPDGVMRWIRDARFPITGAHGGRWRVARFSLDITAERDAARTRGMQELARSIQAAVETERKRIARELHDELGQALTGLKLLLTAVEKPLEIAQPQVSRGVRACVQEVDKAMQSVHAMIYMLRPPALDELGLVAALCSQADSFAKHTGIRCNVDVPDEELALSDEEVTTVFRIAQESLTNVARHAQATRVVLRFAVSGDCLDLSVEDDGKGIEAAREDFGLRGMRERAALLNGSLEVEPRGEGGTVVRLQLPRAGAVLSPQADR